MSSLLLVAGVASAQKIQVLGNPVQPGVPFTVVFTNNAALGIPDSAMPLLHLLQPTGELIVPEVVGCNAVGGLFPPGAKVNLKFTAPATGPGSSGSYVLLFPHGYQTSAVARVDVGLANASFPDIHTYPVNTPANVQGHYVAFPPNQRLDWEIANTGSKSHTFTLGSGILELFTPGGTVAVASSRLTGLTVPAGGVHRILLPLAGLAPGPYTVQLRWVDPGTGSLMVVRHGIEASSKTAVDLRLPGGRNIAQGGVITARLGMRGFGPLGFPPKGQVLAYGLVLGYLPGSSMLPGGVILPLQPDPLVLASLSHGLYGVLRNHIGIAGMLSAYCAHRVWSYPSAGGIQIVHPNIPSVSGLTLRMAGIALDQQGVFGASQPEEITFR